MMHVIGTVYHAGRKCLPLPLTPGTPTATPNGQMVSILLEELKAVYPGFDYETISIDFGKNEQKEE